MYIHSQICYLFHWTTSFVVCFGFWLIPLYTTVVRFSFNQKTHMKSEVKKNLSIPVKSSF